ncbi:DEAD/DEAH box helicase [Bacillus sp. FJAT-27251]|uniref:DEAD/DEAH box helicase n=1 Tax=Bacillus sp. FJAT-27251 TaxID=1684142 RepID=UPI0006A7C033|nr:DEAD/DEAH box helicase [Bacillus sp. FJAT-27251]
MDIKINEHIIRELCGSVSFKRGERFYRSNKVEFKSYSNGFAEAFISGSEDFFVTVSTLDEGRFSVSCSCPKLSSYPKECQHSAAVLLSVLDHQRLGSVPELRSETGMETAVHGDSDSAAAEGNLAEGLLSLFGQKPSRAPRVERQYFENRQVIKPTFVFKAVSVGGHHMIGTKIMLGGIAVKDIRQTLASIKNGEISVLSLSSSFDPALHCFDRISGAVIQQLIQVLADETRFLSEQHTYFKPQQDTLIIPPSSWRIIINLLPHTPSVKLDYRDCLTDGLKIVKDRLPLEFMFLRNEDNSGLLRVKGMGDLLLLDAYEQVLAEGSLIQLNSENSEVLANLKKMLEMAGTNTIRVPKNQLKLFFEKVVPGLKKLGTFQLSGSEWGEFAVKPLTAKLYLDRVKDRLLAGLEFHYGQAVIQPSESRLSGYSNVLIRDTEKEAAIIDILESSEFARTEGGYYLHNEEKEYEFLYHALPKLHKLVQVYATTAVRNRIFKAGSPPAIRVKFKKERTNWLEFKFELNGIPEKEIKDVLAALEEKRKYFRLRSGALLSLEAKEYEEIRRFLISAPIEQEDWENSLNMPVVEGIRLMDSVQNEDVFHQEESFRQFLDSLRQPGKQDFQVPAGLDTVMRRYQKEGFKWMKTLASHGFGGILADDMGLGKTLQSIAYIFSELPDIRRTKRPVLIVCPSSVTYNWLAELSKFAPGVQASVIDGPRKARVRALDKGNRDVIITSYQLLRMDIDWYEKIAFHTVFFDEAQAFKNPVTQTARAVKKVRSDHRFALTGTPVENSIEEIWSIFHVVFPGLFKGLKEYSQLSREQISRRIAPFLLRRLKKDVLSELPGKLETIEYSEMLPEQKKLYAAYLAKLRHDTLKHLNKDTLRKNRIKILAGMTRLRQICCHPALFVDGYKGGSSKYNQLRQIIEESQQTGRRVLVFSQFTSMLELIGRDLAGQGYDFFYLDGRTAPEDRVEICSRFNAGERNLFLISLKAGGTGLNLTGADTVILYDLWWNPAVEEQAADRAHRIGQKNSVQVIKLVARGTIEEKINELQEKKRHMIQELINPGGKVSLSLTDEDIREILRI